MRKQVAEEIVAVDCVMGRGPPSAYHLVTPDLPLAFVQVCLGLLDKLSKMP